LRSSDRGESQQINREIVKILLQKRSKISEKRENFLPAMGRLIAGASVVAVAEVEPLSPRYLGAIGARERS